MHGARHHCGCTTKFYKNLSLTDLCWQHYQGDAYHDNHVQLRGPNIGHEVAISDCGECDHHEVGGLEQVQMPMAGSLEVLNTTNTAQTYTGDCQFQGLMTAVLLGSRTSPTASHLKKCTYEFRKLHMFPSSSLFRQTKLRM